MDKGQAEKNAGAAKRYNEFIDLIKRINSTYIPCDLDDSLKKLLRDIVKAIYEK